MYTIRQLEFEPDQPAAGFLKEITQEDEEGIGGLNPEPLNQMAAFIESHTKFSVVFFERLGWGNTWLIVTDAQLRLWVRADKAAVIKAEQYAKDHGREDAEPNIQEDNTAMSDWVAGKRSE